MRHATGPAARRDAAHASAGCDTDDESGFELRPSAWQDGISDIYLYKAALGYQAHGRALDVGHLSLAEVGFLWHWTNGELGCGELVKNASAEAYQRGLQGYLKREELDGRRPR